MVYVFYNLALFLRSENYYKGYPKNDKKPRYIQGPDW